MKSYWQSEQDTGRQEKAQLLWQQLTEDFFRDHFPQIMLNYAVWVSATRLGITDLSEGTIGPAAEIPELLVTPHKKEPTRQH